VGLEDGSVKQALTTLLVPGEEEDSFGLAKMSHLKEMLATAPFDLSHFQDTLENFIHKSNRLISGETDCALIAAKYAIPKDSDLYATLSKRLITRLAVFSERRKAREKIDHDKELEGLRRGRLNLGNSHGDDPLDESLQVARGAEAKADDEDESSDGGSKRKRSPKKKLVILDEIDEDDENDAREIARLSKVPRKRRQSVEALTRAGFFSIPPDDGIFDEDGKVLKRLKWTDEEKTCVKEGVKAHGMGKWKQIKLDHQQILRNRTPVQMKDCWRTMSNNNEV
jgi:hypothetical protein